MNRSDRPALVAMCAGLLLTVAATAAPYVDRARGDVLADHIRAGYPDYSPTKVDDAATVWLVILTATGVLGVLGWLATIWAVRAGKRWDSWAGTAMFAIGTGLALTALLTKDTSGDPSLAPQLGWIGILPCLAGLLAVVLLWKSPSNTR